MKKTILALALIVGISVASGIIVNHVSKSADGTLTAFAASDPGAGGGR